MKLAFKKEVQNIQTALYNGMHTVVKWSSGSRQAVIGQSKKKLVYIWVTIGTIFHLKRAKLCCDYVKSFLFLARHQDCITIWTLDSVKLEKR